MKQVHGGNIEKAKKRYNLHEDEIIDFSANINFLGPPPGLINYLDKNLKNIIHYPEPASERFKKKLARQLNVDYNNLIISNGAVELIYQITNWEQFDVVLIPAPAFSEYEFAAKSSGKQVKYIYGKRENNFKININKIINNLDDVDLIFICNPGNPAGTLINIKDIEYLLNCAYRHRVFVVLDEAFIDFVSCGEEFTAIKMINKYTNLFVLRSMTKVYAIPGLRLGYGVGTSELINKLEQDRDPWSVNLLAQKAGEFVIEQKDYRKESYEKNKIERDYFFNQLKQIQGIQPFYPTANFIFIDIGKTDFNASQLTDKLASQGLLIRNCNSYTGLNEDYIRIAVKSRQENIQLLDKLNMIL